jgi:hypothetical protein
VTPASILEKIGKADGLSDVLLPSVGTEGATVHKYVELAQEDRCDGQALHRLAGYRP